MSTIPAGALKHRVELQRATEGEDALGQEKPEWATYDEVYCRLRPLRGRERWMAQQAQSEVTHEIDLRHREGVQAKDRARMGTRVFEILAPIYPGDRWDDMTLLVKEEVD